MILRFPFPRFLLFKRTEGGKYDIDSALKDKDKKKRVHIACPKCKWQPNGYPYWQCERCFVNFDTFETKAHCPTDACGNSWKQTQCISCYAHSDHDAWYTEADEDDE